MKNINFLTKPGFATAIALAGGFWFTQLFLWSSISSVLGALPKTGILLSLGLFVFLFVIRMFSSSARLPAILGICSSGVLISLYLYLNYFMMRSSNSIALLFLLAFGLTVVGIALDIERFLHPAKMCNGISKLTPITTPLGGETLNHP